jgi:biotin carboxyl carrier protein
MGLRNAMALLEGMGMRVVAEGKGKIVEQNVAVGSAITKGQIINLILE